MSREIDAEVALAMGWTTVIEGDFTDMVAGYPPGADAATSVPHYSTSIAAAWRVVERMRELGWMFKLSGGPSHEWKALFWPAGRPVDAVGAHADTAPLAICNAALRAIRGAGE